MLDTLQPILVLAGSYRQFRNWLCENNYSLINYKYIRNQEDLLGYHEAKIIRVGTWWEKDIDHRIIENLEKENERRNQIN